MAGGIRARLDRLTSPDLKKLISDAIAADKKTPSKEGGKLIAEMNKLWVIVLKDLKEYDATLAGIEKQLKAAAGKTDIADSAFDEIGTAITEARKKLGPIDNDLTKFEKLEASLKKMYKL